MRYRALSPTGDYTFGQGQGNFLINTPEAVAQVVKTSLQLWLNEWFLDTTAGTPYMGAILGKYGQASADQAIQTVIRACQGVVDIQTYSSVVNPRTRALSVSATINTIYGPTQLELNDYVTF